ALEQFFRFFAAIAAEVGVQKIDHGPQVAAFLDVHLKQIAQIVERRRSVAEEALLFDGGGLGVALRYDEAAQRGTMFARNLLPDRLAIVVAKADTAGIFGVSEKNPPTIFPHAHLAQPGPAVGLHP